jgi:oligogalacturonide lyase
MPGTCTRRVFLSGLPALGILGAPGSGQAVPSEAKRYPDPATEFEVVRLTDPAHTSRLPGYYNRAISHRGNFLLYTSDRGGAPQAYRMDLKTFESRQITEAGALLPSSLVLATDEKAFHFADGSTVFTGNLSNLRHKPVYDAPAGFEIRGLAASDDTTHLFVVENSSNIWGLRAVRLVGNGPAGSVESTEPISDAMPRPKRAGILYRRGGELWLTNYDGAQNHRLRVAAGGIGPALWSSDGRTVFYLNFPEGGKALNNIREFDPDTNEDRPVANTSQYVHFGRNADSTVFAGASGSKASPYILLLVRSVKRELALCEHRASDPTQAAPIFAPNSQRVFFQSDRHGKMAIYSVRVERFVDETES